MVEEAFALEDTLQELVAHHPELLSGEQMDPNDPRRWILVGREQGIADIVGGGHRWALDHRTFSFSCLVGKTHHVESFAEMGIVAA